MVQTHRCRYLHTDEPILFMAYPRQSPPRNLAAFDDYDENLLHAADAHEAWATPMAYDENPLHAANTGEAWTTPKTDSSVEDSQGASA